jgi:hypothetical protein
MLRRAHTMGDTASFFKCLGSPDNALLLSEGSPMIGDPPKIQIWLPECFEIIVKSGARTLLGTLFGRLCESWVTFRKPAYTFTD